MAQVPFRAVVLLNLSRDQIDRTIDVTQIPSFPGAAAAVPIRSFLSTFLSEIGFL